MPIEMTIKSLDPNRPNNVLWDEIEKSQNELTQFLKKSRPEIETAKVRPLAGFPTGVEGCVIMVAIAFGKGFVEGASEELGKETGKKVVEWLKARFKDISITDIVDK